MELFYFKHSILNCSILSILLIFTEIIHDASVMYLKIVFYPTVLTTITPLFFLFFNLVTLKLKKESPSKSIFKFICKTSSIVTTLFVFVLYVFRTKVYRIEIKELQGGLSDEEIKHFTRIIKNNTVMAIFGAIDSELFKNNSISKFLAKKEDYKTLGFSYNNIDITNKRLSEAKHGIIYIFRGRTINKNSIDLQDFVDSLK